MPALVDAIRGSVASREWIAACKRLKETLWHHDTEYPVTAIAGIIKGAGEDAVLVSDVGNNEMWLSRAFVYSGRANRILYSNNFGSLGCALPKAIGAHYATGRRVICFAGDLGIQMNMQELQTASHEKLPITMVILNTSSSAMIRERQKRKGYAHYVHTTTDSGYSIPDFKAVAQSYDIPHVVVDEHAENVSSLPPGPTIIEMRINPQLDVMPLLPKENTCQDFIPPLPREQYETLDNI
jgi:acetolactate synthase-1/2/3 large subunit